VPIWHLRSIQVIKQTNREYTRIGIKKICNAMFMRKEKGRKEDKGEVEIIFKLQQQENKLINGLMKQN
jgi:hypothetical protein